MIGRKAVTGLLLLCALVFCAVGASSASAAKGTTAFECVEGGEGPKYSDADCETTSETGKFSHKEIKPGVVTEISSKLISNYKLNTTLLTLATEVTCTEQSTKGTLENLAAPMRVTGSAEITFNGCTVNKPAKCVVKQPIIAKTMVNSKIINEPPVGEEMGLEYEPSVAGGNFTELTFKNKSETEKCGIANGEKPFPVKGSIIGTGSTSNMTGSIQRFNKGEASMQKLSVGTEAAAATLEGQTTIEMKGGPGLALTTTAE